MCLALVSLKDLDGRVGTSYVLRQESRTMSRSTSQTYDAFPYLQHAPFLGYYWYPREESPLAQA
jgi:hypothetical protein